MSNEFTLRHINRLKFPDKDIIICEDDLHHQAEITVKLSQIIDRQGSTECHFVPSGIAAAAIISHLKDRIKLLILDHDMPLGNGTDLIRWIKSIGHNIPIITASGIDHNNDYMKNLCVSLEMECHKFSKFDVIEGKADKLILDILKA